jgi:hypothetical protein
MNRVGTLAGWGRLIKRGATVSESAGRSDAPSPARIATAAQRQGVALGGIEISAIISSSRKGVSVAIRISCRRDVELEWASVYRPTPRKPNSGSRRAVLVFCALPLARQMGVTAVRDRVRPLHSTGTIWSDGTK